MNSGSAPTQRRQTHQRRRARPVPAGPWSPGLHVGAASPPLPPPPPRVRRPLPAWGGPRPSLCCVTATPSPAGPGARHAALFPRTRCDEIRDKRARPGPRVSSGRRVSSVVLPLAEGSSSSSDPSALRALSRRRVPKRLGHCGPKGGGRTQARGTAVAGHVGKHTAGLPTRTRLPPGPCSERNQRGPAPPGTAGGDSQQQRNK